MKTNVASTSIAVYHEQKTKEMMQTQLQQVAAYVVAETKAGRACCIGSICDHWQMLGHRKGLGQQGIVSRVCNDLEKAQTVEVGGKEYRYEAVSPKKYGRNVVKHFCMVLNHKAPEGVQIEMF
jgi:hypothetical protein